MKKPDNIDKMWKLFIERVQITDAPRIQLYEMEMAFKAGCAALLMEMKGPMTDLPDDEGIKVLESWKNELNEFFNKRVREYNGV